MKLITFSTYPEAAPTLKGLNAQALSSPTTDQFTPSPQPTVYAIKDGWILITEIGPLSTLSSILTFPHNFDTLYNFGVAGSFQKEDICQLIKVGTVEMMASKFTLPLVFGEGASLLTTYAPLYDRSKHKQYPQSRLVDMEGYATALAAKRLGKKLTMWKIVSDIISEDSTNQIAKRLPTLAEELAHFIITKELSHEGSPHP
jgi:hypothetical protein